MIKIDDRFVVTFIAISLPSFLVCVLFLIFIAMGFDRISPDEAFESLHITLPVVITYVGAIVGFSFSRNPSDFLATLDQKNARVQLQDRLRPIVSLILTVGLLMLLLLLTLFFLLDVITFAAFKKSVASVTWGLTGVTSFIVGKYFGKEIVHSNALRKRSSPESGTTNSENKYSV